MKMTQNSSILVSICIASLGAIAYCAYRIVKHKRPITDILNSCDIQQVNNFSLKSVIEWIDNVVGDELSPYNKLEVNILPNTATKEAFGDNIKLSHIETNHCNFIIIMDTETKQVVKRKLVINNSVADDLAAIKEGKIFKFPIE